MDGYGKELILDLENCDPKTFSRSSIKIFCRGLCRKIGMEPEDLHFWDDQDTPEEEKVTEPHLVGISAVQFIRTSNITIHTLSILKTVYLNIFSCKDFDEKMAAEFSREWFGGEFNRFHTIRRG